MDGWRRKTTKGIVLPTSSASLMAPSNAERDIGLDSRALVIVLLLSEGKLRDEDVE